MKKRLGDRSRWLGTILQIGGVVGVVISLLAFILIPIGSPQVLHPIQGSITSAAEQVRAAETAIDLVSESLTSAGITLGDVAGLFTKSDLFLDDTVGVLETIGTAIGEDASDTIVATHQSVIAAQEGARAIDTTLKALSVVEFITGISYDPEKTLSGSLEEVANNLEVLPETLSEIHASMNSSAESLDRLRPQISIVAADLDEFSENIFTLVDEVEAQRAVLQIVSDNVEGFNETLESWFGTGTVLLMIAAVGMGIIYLAVYTVGAELRNKESPEAAR
jgi:methyl-accepting chemotaxis protein